MPPIIIFIDYALLVGILKKSNLTTTVSIDKLNLRLIRAGEYLSRFPLLIRHKPRKANFMLDTLSCLPIVDNPKLKAEAKNIPRSS